MNGAGGCGKPTKLTKRNINNILEMLENKVSKRDIVKKYKIGMERLYSIMEKHGMRSPQPQKEVITENQKIDAALAYTKALTKYFESFNQGNEVLMLINKRVIKGRVVRRTKGYIEAETKNGRILVQKSDLADKSIKIKHNCTSPVNAGLILEVCQG